jgi:hypothetical protein
MQTTTLGGQLLSDDIGTIVGTVTPIVASVLQQARGYQPYAGWGSLGQPGFGFQPYPQAGFQSPLFGHQQPFGGQPQEIAQIVSAVTPLVVSLLQSKGHASPMGFNAWLPFPQAAWSGFQGLPPQDIVHIVNTVTPIVASLVQSRAYQAQGGYNMPRAA